MSRLLKENNQAFIVTLYTILGKTQKENIDAMDLYQNYGIPSQVLLLQKMRLILRLKIC